MPVYDYKCTCGHTFECRQSFESEPFATCPKCSKIAHRQLHCPPIIFKGSGFYITDHRKEGGEEKAKRVAKDDESAGDSKSGTKSEKSDTSEKSEKPAKSEKSEKPAKSGKSEKAAAKKD